MLTSRWAVLQVFSDLWSWSTLEILPSAYLLSKAYSYFRFNLIARSGIDQACKVIIFVVFREYYSSWCVHVYLSTTWHHICLESAYNGKQFKMTLKCSIKDKCNFCRNIKLVPVMEKLQQNHLLFSNTWFPLSVEKGEPAETTVRNRMSSNKPVQRTHFLLLFTYQNT